MLTSQQEDAVRRLCDAFQGTAGQDQALELLLVALGDKRGAHIPFTEVGDEQGTYSSAVEDVADAFDLAWRRKTRTTSDQIHVLKYFVGNTANLATELYEADSYADRLEVLDVPEEAVTFYREESTQSGYPAAVADTWQRERFDWDELRYLALVFYVPACSEDAVEAAIETGKRRYDRLETVDDAVGGEVILPLADNLVFPTRDA